MTENFSGADSFCILCSDKGLVPGGQEAWQPSTQLPGQFKGSGCWHVTGQAFPQALNRHSHSKPASLFNSSQLRAETHHHSDHTLESDKATDKRSFSVKFSLKFFSSMQISDYDAVKQQIQTIGMNDSSDQSYGACGQMFQFPAHNCN